MLNGLSPRFDNILNVIMHRQPFPTYDEACSMLMLVEERLNRSKNLALPWTVPHCLPKSWLLKLPLRTAKMNLQLNNANNETQIEQAAEEVEIVDVDATTDINHDHNINNGLLLSGQTAIRCGNNNMLLGLQFLIRWVNKEFFVPDLHSNSNRCRSSPQSRNINQRRTLPTPSTP